MDPGTLMALAGLTSGVIGSFSGNQGKKSSSFDRQQKNTIHDVINSIKQMKGGAQDITQNQNYQQGQDWLSSLFNDQDFFKNFEAPLQRNFEENTIPDLANRFAGMGSGGSLGSTAFRNQANREGERLHENIAALRGGLQQQGVNQGLQYAQQPFSNLMQLYNQAIGSPINNQYQPPSAGFGSLAAPFLQGAGSYWGGQGGRNNDQSYAFGGGY